jgi:hypothetical protein
VGELSPVFASYKVSAGKKFVTSCFITGAVLTPTPKVFAVVGLRQCIEEIAIVVPEL